SSLSDRMPSVNANEVMADLLLRLPGELELQYPAHRLAGVRPTLNPGVLARGGVSYGVLPGEAEFACDLRTVPGLTRDGVDASLRSWLTQMRAVHPGVSLELSYEPGLEWIPCAEIDLDHPLVTATQRAADHVLGAAPALSMFPGTT